MARACTCCQHAQRRTLDAALVGGASIDSVAAAHGVSRDAAARHRARHIPAALARAKQRAGEAADDDLLGQVVAIRARAEALLDRAEAEGDIPAATGALRELRRTVELLGKVTGELAAATGPKTVNILAVEGWPELRDAILSALAPYAEARQAVARVLRAEAVPA